MDNENNKENLNFETSIKELEKIANELEKGDLSLEESIKMFETGMLLSNKCSEFLDEAEKRITILINDDTCNGNIKEEDFIAKD